MEKGVDYNQHVLLTKPFAIALLHFVLQGQSCLLLQVSLDFLLVQSNPLLRESVPRQVDEKSRGPQGERGLEFSRRKKGQTFFPPLHSLGLYNNNVSCLRTISGKKTFWLILLSQIVNYGSRSGEVFTTSRHSFDSL